jgi:iron complex transport system ATP-binding protein
MNLIDIENLNFSYGNNTVLQNISIHVMPSEFISIIGPNGAGKSTLLKLIDGIYLNPDGQILINGSHVRSMSRKDLARQVAYLPQEIDLAFAYSVEDVVKMGRFPYLHGIQLYSDQDDQIVNYSMDLLDVLQFRSRSFRELSGGEKQRVMIASALAQEPKILLLDEPTSALDLHHQIEIYQILKVQQEERQLTVIVVTHDINLAAQFCGRMILIDKGKIIRDGTPDDVLKFQVLQKTFGVNVYIDINPMTNSLYILPYQ